MRINDMANAICCVLQKDGNVALIENFVEIRSDHFFIGCQDSFAMCSFGRVTNRTRVYDFLWQVPAM